MPLGVRCRGFSFKAYGLFGHFIPKSEVPHLTMPTNIRLGWTCLLECDAPAFHSKYSFLFLAFFTPRPKILDKDEHAYWSSMPRLFIQSIVAFSGILYPRVQCCTLHFHKYKSLRQSDRPDFNFNHSCLWWHYLPKCVAFHPGLLTKFRRGRT